MAFYEIAKNANLIFSPLRFKIVILSEYKPSNSSILYKQVQYGTAGREKSLLLRNRVKNPGSPKKRALKSIAPKTHIFSTTGNRPERQTLTISH
mmetsp:Transcript_1818/g.4815  ORF Transcript_1818/g.4815 Transcript_1818/m.4815 type:complete len:94 (-) Transcript_1818:114-395(-)